MQFNPKALVPLGICLALLMLVLKAQQSGVDLAIRVALWGMLVLMSVVAIVKMVRRRNMTIVTQADTMPERIRRWVLGETKDRQR